MKKHNDQIIKNALKDFVSQKHLSEGYIEAKIKKIWVEELGVLLQKYTQKIWYKRGKLYIKINSASLKTELYYGREQLTNKFNAYFEKKVIEELIIM